MSGFRAALAALAAGVAAVLAGGLPAAASTGGKVTTPEEAGYRASGAQFKTVQASTYLGDPAQFPGGDYILPSVQLRSADQVVTLYAYAFNGAGYLNEFYVWSPSSML